MGVVILAILVPVAIVAVVIRGLINTLGKERTKELLKSAFVRKEK